VEKEYGAVVGAVVVLIDQEFFVCCVSRAVATTLGIIKLTHTDHILI